MRELLEEIEEGKKAKGLIFSQNNFRLSTVKVYFSGAKEGELSNVALKVSGLQEELTKLKLEESLGSEAIKVNTNFQNTLDSRYKGKMS